MQLSIDFGVSELQVTIRWLEKAELGQARYGADGNFRRFKHQARTIVIIIFEHRDRTDRTFMLKTLQLDRLIRQRCTDMPEKENWEMETIWRRPKETWEARESISFFLRLLELRIYATLTIRR